jgi:hypothetical protein
MQTKELAEKLADMLRMRTKINKSIDISLEQIPTGYLVTVMNFTNNDKIVVDLQDRAVTVNYGLNGSNLTLEETSQNSKLDSELLQSTFDDIDTILANGGAIIRKTYKGKIISETLEALGKKITTKHFAFLPFVKKERKTIAIAPWIQ